MGLFLCPNISGAADYETGTVDGYHFNLHAITNGAFCPSGTMDWVCEQFAPSTWSVHEYGVAMFASRSNRLYGSSETVQPSSIRYMTLIRT